MIRRLLILTAISITTLAALIVPTSLLSAGITSLDINSSNHHYVSYNPLEIGPGSRIKHLYTSHGRLLEGKYTSSITIAAAGDIMVHSPQFQSAYDRSRNTYDFSEHFEQIAPYLQKADLAVANLETTLTGPAYPYSGYPRFNSPPELAGNLKETGFDLLFTANNHSLDYGETGVRQTITHLEAAGLNFVGTARDRAEREHGHREEINGIEMAFFAYTYGTNGIPIPRGKEYLVTLLDEKQIIADTQRAKQQEGADIVIISLHWGQEYQRLPTTGQRELARRLIEQGVDVIIGTHPHVIQPAEMIQAEDRSGLVLYSLGNFISNQRKIYRDTGIIVYFQIEKDLASGKTTVSLAEILPTWVLRKDRLGPDRYAILPLNESFAENGIPEAVSLSRQQINRMQEALLETEDIFWRYWDAEHHLHSGTSGMTPGLPGWLSCRGKPGYGLEPA